VSGDGWLTCTHGVGRLGRLGEIMIERAWPPILLPPFRLQPLARLCAAREAPSTVKLCVGPPVQ